MYFGQLAYASRTRPRIARSDTSVVLRLIRRRLRVPRSMARSPRSESGRRFFQNGSPGVSITLCRSITTSRPSTLEAMRGSPKIGEAHIAPWLSDVAAMTIRCSARNRRGPGLSEPAIIGALSSATATCRARSCARRSPS
jgi:hypothetical protein